MAEPSGCHFSFNPQYRVRGILKVTNSIHGYEWWGGGRTVWHFSVTAWNVNQIPFWILMWQHSIYVTYIYLYAIGSYRIITDYIILDNIRSYHGLYQIMDHGSWIMDRWIMDYGSWIMDHWSWIMDHGSWIMNHGSWIIDHGSYHIVNHII